MNTKTAFRYSMIPFILGANWRARWYAERYFGTFRVKAQILDQKFHFSLLFSVASRFRKINFSNNYADFLLSELRHFAAEFPDKLLVLIATTPRYRAFVQEHRAELEKYYVLSDPELSFLVKESPADRVPHLKGDPS